MDGDGRELKPSSSWNNSSSSSTSYQSEEETVDLRRGPWTVEEDLTLINYIASHGEGRWNSLARCAGLKRTGKSCRLRWLNYLRPDVRRGNITLEEQLMILELHSRWGNRWSKIAQHLPGRTDNEIKNYWRTRVQKHAKQLKCDVNSKQFKDAMRYLWMPRLLERIQSSSATSAAAAEHFGVGLNMTPSNYSTSDNLNVGAAGLLLPAIGFQSPPYQITNNYMIHTTTESSSAAAVSSDSLVTPSDLTSDDNIIGAGVNYNFNDTDYFRGGYADSLIGFPAAEQSSQGPWLPDSGSDISKNVLNVEDVWFFSSRSN